MELSIIFPEIIDLSRAIEAQSTAR
jgi:hypothetical protein